MGAFDEWADKRWLTGESRDMARDIWNAALNHAADTCRRQRTWKDNQYSYVAFECETAILKEVIHE